jgi:hypothetical protein
MMNTQHEINLAPLQMGEYQNQGPNQPDNLTDHNILPTNKEEILLQYPATMSILEVLQTYPSQCKSSISTLGVVDPTNTQLVIFDLDNGEPCLPTLVAF